ncbi:uncharacterized protein NDAI_0E03860 [Naumovozyma dairenensis CBS 421]|uniref:SWIRM domain-containing protein n=1 Tax=Naumovozyma dairenensis (strain ATCC 10597 / BCRC 20456 / CBS 421 / NBRC 0211 / NRRL Y-12639) TaxID=1071378 RepID=G0WBT3_NAUDC|nr:hypothetical protein NDAI_0E03860 [Naumovozyma dairenensis CBS 421]CCD25203.1 hypothetical protein NDAI_0E03860 [Naumovozyma dairenensis CBS 421]
MQLFSPQAENQALTNHPKTNNDATGNNSPNDSDPGLLSLLHQRVLIATNSAKLRKTNSNPSTFNFNNNNASTIINTSNSRNQNSETSSITSDEHLIPSPPLSPTISTVDTTQLANFSDIYESKNGITLLPSWERGLTTKDYHYRLTQFLSRYKTVFGNEAKDIITVPRSIKRLRSYNRNTNNQFNKDRSGKAQIITRRYNTRSEGERTPRASSKSSYYTKDSQYETYDRHLLTPPSPRRNISYGRSITPIRRVKKTLPMVSSPLASASAIHSAPQYIPNMSWEKLPDYSPSTSTLPANNPKCLKVEWKGSPMDLSHDPLKNNLHPAELILAQVLRLPCDLYLDSKRRLFLEKVHRLKKGLPFRRTDAQKACRIDVNKASRLYAAFEKVGWLKDSNFLSKL